MGSILKKASKWVIWKILNLIGFVACLAGSIAFGILAGVILVGIVWFLINFFVGTFEWIKSGVATTFIVWTPVWTRTGIVIGGVIAFVLAIWVIDGFSGNADGFICSREEVI